ncbi:hypothetical protein IKF27_00035 [Candidatus Saccharibacteria bacterium]|nr:hypothetical protein [Candidatus Saccharibacteria bacterium]
MRFDEKPKRRSLHLGKSRVDVSREKGASRFKKSFKVEKVKAEEEAPVYLREKPEKLPAGYDEDETFSESLKGAMKNHIPLVVAGAALLIAVGFFTGFIPGLFKHDEPEKTAVATTEPAEKTKVVFTQGKFNLSTENTDAGVDIICETSTDEEGNEKKTCRTKTEEDKKKEQEEKEREEQEKKAKEEQEKEKIEDEAAKKLKQKQAEAAAKEEASSSSGNTKTPEGPVKVTGITSISGCPAEAVSNSVVVLRASALPSSAANINVIWSSTSSASVVYNDDGSVATVSVGEGEKVIITAMTVDGGYSEHCSFPIVSELTR